MPVRWWLTGLVLGFFVVHVASHEGPFPKETLWKIFPDAENFAARKKTLTAKELADIEQLTGHKAEPEDHEFTFYVAIGKDKSGRSRSLGAVFILHGSGPQGIIDMAIGFSTDFMVQGIVITENKNDPKIEKPDFLNQFTRKTPKDPLTVGKDIRFTGDAKSAEVFIKTVRKGMYLLGLILRG